MAGTVVVIDHPLVQHKLTLLRKAETSAAVFRALLREISMLLMLELIPSARVGHIGLYRDPKTHVAVEYYFRVPEDIPERDALVVDPMLATGNSAVAALHRLKDTGAKTLKFVCLLAAPEGIAHVHEQHPDVPIYTAAVDERLDAHDYIIPGLGDAGDRLFGTK